jgi:3-dehydroquinate synthetase
VVQIFYAFFPRRNAAAQLFRRGGTRRHRVRGAVSSHPPQAEVFAVSTEDVWRHQGGCLAGALSGIPHEVLFLPGGEDRKRLAPLEQLAEEMVELGADRTSVVVAYGGGIVTDMAGFLAAIFMRGIPLVQIPTTLLGQVDASIGGKTGVNLVSGKNLIGSFHQPVAVLIDPAVLDTCPSASTARGSTKLSRPASSATARCSIFWPSAAPRCWPAIRTPWTASSTIRSA